MASTKQRQQQARDKRRLDRAYTKAVEMHELMKDISPESWVFRVDIDGPSSGLHSWATPKRLTPLGPNGVLRDVIAVRDNPVLRDLSVAQKDLVNAACLVGQMMANDGVKELGNKVFAVAAALFQQLMTSVDNRARHLRIKVTSVPSPYKMLMPDAEPFVVGFQQGQGVELLDSNDQLIWSYMPSVA